VRFARVTLGHHDRRVLCSDFGTLFPNVRGDMGKIAGCVTFVNAAGIRAAIVYVCMGWMDALNHIPDKDCRCKIPVPHCHKLNAVKSRMRNLPLDPM